MFYSKYSNYSPDQIINGNYEKVAEKILGLAPSEEIKRKIQEILYEGGFDNFSVNLGDEKYIPNHKDSPTLESTRRLHYAYFLANNPETLEVMEKNSSMLFHGTKIDALPSILKYGINSVNESRDNGIDVTTGEEWSRINGKRDFISFTNSLGTALSYAEYHFGKETNTSFGIMLGMASDKLENLRGVSINSDISEVGILKNIPIENISMLTVPKEKVEFVKRILSNSHIKVFGIDMDDPFFYMTYEQEMMEYLSTDRQEEKPKKEYGKDDMKKISFGQKLSKIFTLFNSKDREPKGRNDIYDDRGDR